ncbi:MAG: hypothetical protein U0Y10_06900 [Spirosomataceae bacterium]
MKNNTQILLWIALAFSLSGKAQITPNSIKYAKIDFGAGDAKTAAIEAIEKARSPQSANAFYKIINQKIVFYYIGQYPQSTGFNAADFIDKCDRERAIATTSIQEDKLFPNDRAGLETAHGLGVIKADLWNHSRKEITVDGIKTLIITTNKVVVGPFANNYRFDFPGRGNTNPSKNTYKWQTLGDSKAYLIEQTLNANPAASLEKIWTEGESAVVKVGMMNPPTTPLNIGETQVNVSGYQKLGFINLGMISTSKPELGKFYYVKCKFVGVPETFVYKILFFAGEHGEHKQPDGSRIGLDPQP